MKPVSRPDLPTQLADVHHAIVSCERCPRLREYCRQRRTREEARLSRRDVLGPAGAGLRRPGRASADRRSGAGGTRRQPDRPRLHGRRHRRLRRFPDGRAASHRLRQPRHVAATSTMGWHCTTRTSSRPSAAPRRTTSRGRKRSPAASITWMPSSRTSPTSASSSRSARSDSTRGCSVLKRRGVRVSPKPQFGARRRRDARCRRHAAARRADRLLSPEPAEHQHRRADRPDDARRVPPGAATGEHRSGVTTGRCTDKVPTPRCSRLGRKGLR